MLLAEYLLGAVRLAGTSSSHLSFVSRRWPAHASRSSYAAYCVFMNANRTVWLASEQVQMLHQVTKHGAMLELPLQFEIVGDMLCFMPEDLKTPDTKGSSRGRRRRCSRSMACRNGGKSASPFETNKHPRAAVTSVALARLLHPGSWRWQSVRRSKQRTLSRRGIAARRNPKDAELFPLTALRLTASHESLKKGEAARLRHLQEEASGPGNKNSGVTAVQKPCYEVVFHGEGLRLFFCLMAPIFLSFGVSELRLLHSALHTRERVCIEHFSRRSGAEEGAACAQLRAVVSWTVHEGVQLWHSGFSAPCSPGETSRSRSRREPSWTRISSKT